jgi:hypothetical protein
MKRLAFALSVFALVACRPADTPPVTDETTPPAMAPAPAPADTLIVPDTMVDTLMRRDTLVRQP